MDLRLWERQVSQSVLSSSHITAGLESTREAQLGPKGQGMLLAGLVLEEEEEVALGKSELEGMTSLQGVGACVESQCRLNERADSWECHREEEEHEGEEEKGGHGAGQQCLAALSVTCTWSVPWQPWARKTPTPLLTFLEHLAFNKGEQLFALLATPSQTLRQCDQE